MNLGGGRFKPEVFFTLPLCGLSFILACVAIITQNWVSGRSVGVGAEAADNYVDFNFGLFAGEYKYVVGASSSVNAVKMSCPGGECLFSCGPDKENREADVTDYLKAECPVRNAFADPYFCVEDVYDGSDVDCDDGNHYNSSLASDGGPYSFSRPLYAMSVVFLFLGILLTLVSTVAGAYNAFRNPISYIASYQGLWIWHTSAALLYFLCICLYGGLFDQQMKGAPPLPNILRLNQAAGPVWDSEGKGKKGRGYSLGFSYWLIFVTMILHLVCVGLVYWYKFKRDRPKKDAVTEVNYDAKAAPDKNAMLF